jgi:hypothetical protein
MILVAVVAMTLATPAASYASAPSPGVLGLSFDTSGSGSIVATLTTSWGVGDCVALSGTTIEVRRPDDSGQFFLAWHQWGYTNHTNNFDQWHSEFRLVDAAWTTIFLIDPVMDGAKMRTADQVYEWTAYSSVRQIDPQRFARVANVVWAGSC